MELQRCRDRVIAAALATPTASREHFSLQTLAALLLMPIGLCVTSPTSMLAKLFRESYPRRVFRRVVRSEWRARQTELSSVELSDLAFDLEFSVERLPARLADLHPDRSQNGSARMPEWSVRLALKARLATAQV